MSNNKFKALFLAFVLASSSIVCAQGLSSMKAHDKLGVTCEQCHGTKAPMSAPDEKQCLACHANSGGHYRGTKLYASGFGVPKVYMESGRERPAAIHDSHSGPVRCTVCHTAHKAPPKMYCNNCHSFDVKTK